MLKYLVMDVDGSLTDGKVYIGKDGELMKAFSVKDGYVFNYILKPLNIIPIIITARNSEIVKNRCAELGIEHVFQGVHDKIGILKQIIGENNLCKCAYFGDDIIDLQCMEPIKEAGGVVGCPQDAVEQIKIVSDFVCSSKAGEGALREFSKWLVSPKIDNRDIQKRINEVVEYLKSLKVTVNDIGKHVIDDNFFYSVQNYVPSSPDVSMLESHRKYIDIQILVTGKEIMEIADTSRLKLAYTYDSDKDVMFWNDTRRSAIVELNAGDYIVLYPEHAHRSIRIGENLEAVLKIVGKIRVL